MSLNKVGFTQPEITIFEQMLYADQLRGHHGTGMFFDAKDGGVDHIRGAMNASVFLADKEVGKHLTKAYQSASFIVGHNRYATKGAHTNENTHPFSEQNITLVHNGTLFAHRTLKNVEVDSHAICHAFAEKGEAETIKEIDGAFALVWYNSDTKKLHFIRNSQRPLHIIHTKNVIALASEAKLAEWIFSRNREMVTKVEECEVGVMYTFDRHTREITKEVMELRVWKKQEYQNNQSEFYGKAYSTGYWKGNVWTPFRKTIEEDKEIDKRIGEIMGEPKYLPATVANNVVNMPEYRMGDVVDFTPLSIDAKGNGYQLTLIAQSGVNSKTMYAIFYHQDKGWLDTLMMFHTVRATVLAIRQKHGVCSLVLKDPKTVGTVAEDDYADDVMSTAFDNSEIPDLTGAVH